MHAMLLALVYLNAAGISLLLPKQINLFIKTTATAKYNFHERYNRSGELCGKMNVSHSHSLRAVTGRNVKKK